ncbi:hypothetical protein ACP4OV_015170 [Aristida adscensionis]
MAGPRRSSPECLMMAAAAAIGRLDGDRGCGGATARDTPRHTGQLFPGPLSTNVREYSLEATSKHYHPMIEVKQGQAQAILNL